MSHAELIERGIGLTDPAHRMLAIERWQASAAAHKPRIRNLLHDRKLITGEFWPHPAQNGERRVTLPLGDDLAQMMSAMLLPGIPRISAMPTVSQDKDAQRLADEVQNFIFALLDVTHGVQRMQQWGTETTVAGVGGMHSKADKWALADEAPLLFEVADSAGLLYHIGPRDTVDFCFIKHMLTADEMRRDLKAQPRGYGFSVGVLGSQSMKYEVWCYYTEERLMTPAGPERRVFYTLMQNNEFLYPLMDITPLWPRIPLHIAFSRGYVWPDREDMRARGALTGNQSLIAYMSDYFSQLANNNLNYVNPAMLWYKDPGRDDGDELDLSPGVINDMFIGEKLESVQAGQSPKEAMALYQVLQQALGNSTVPFLYNQMNVEGVSGSALQQMIQPAMLRNQMKQFEMQYTIRDWIVLNLEHLSKVLGPAGLELFGINPHDGKMLLQRVTSEQLGQHLRISVELPQETPRDVIAYVAMLQGLMREGIVPRALGMEQIAQLIKLKVTDMTTMMELTAQDDAYKAMLQGLQAKAQQLAPYLQGQQQLSPVQIANNQAMNPNVLSDGRRPPLLPAQQQDPLLSGSTQALEGPVQQAAQAAQQPHIGGY